MASWFDSNVPTGRTARQRTPGYQAPAPPVTTAPPTDEYATNTPAGPNGGPASGNTGVSGTGPGGTPPPPVVPPAGRGAAPSGVDAAKWAAGHTSPKYAFMDVSRKYDQRTEAGRNQTLAELQQQYPQWFTGWGIQGDKLKHLSGSLAAEWDGYNEFDAWRGSKAGEWAPQWIPTQLNGQAYLGEDAAPAATAPPASAATPAASASLPASPMALSGPVSNLTPAASAAQPVNGGAYPEQSYSGADYSGFGALMQPWEYEFAFPYFDAPEGSEVFNDPGYLFRQEQGNKAIQRSAASQGTVLNPATVKALQEYNSGLASQEYGNVYNRRLGEHGRAHDQAFNAYSSAYNTFNRNQDAPFNRLASLAGLGQTSAGQLGAAGSAFGANYGNTAMSGAGAQGGFWADAANANAAGKVAGSNAWAGALGNIGNNMMGSYYANQMMRPPRQPVSANPFNFGTPVNVGGLG